MLVVKNILTGQYFRQFTWCDQEPVFGDIAKAYPFKSETDAVIVAQDCIDTFKLNVKVEQCDTTSK